MNETFEVAERQHGPMTRAQLVELGLSDSQIRRRVSAGVLARVLPNVFRVRERPRSGACSPRRNTGRRNHGSR